MDTFVVSYLGAILVIPNWVAASRTSKSLAARPWWQLPKLRLYRFLTVFTLAFLGWSAVLALAFTLAGNAHVMSVGDALHAWMTGMEGHLMISAPGVLLAHGWYGLTRWRASRRAATPSRSA